MNLIENKYNQYCSASLDINEHLPTLKRYALECESITEMGVRSIISTWAFLAAKPKKMLSIDICHPSVFGANLEEVYTECQKEGIDFKFLQSSTLEITIEETDLLFIDTIHGYKQLKQELTIHGNKAKKYLIFNDTESCPEIMPAIIEFVNENNCWSILEDFKNNNGLLILKNKGYVNEHN